MTNAKKTSKRKPARLPVLTPDQFDDLDWYFQGNEPSEPGSESAHAAVIRKEAGVHDAPEPAGVAEDAMLSYIDRKREWESIVGKVENMSDASVGVLAAWFAADEADRHRVIADDVLRAACKEYDQWAR